MATLAVPCTPGTSLALNFTFVCLRPASLKILYISNMEQPIIELNYGVF